MFNNFTVGIWNRGPSAKVGGITIPGVLELIENIDVDVQPYSTELLLLAYGYNISVNKRIYVDYFDANIKIGTIFKYTDKYDKEVSLEVKAIPWDDGYMEVMCLGI